MTNKYIKKMLNIMNYQGNTHQSYSQYRCDICCICVLLLHNLLRLGQGNESMEQYLWELDLMPSHFQAFPLGGQRSTSSGSHHSTHSKDSSQQLQYGPRGTDKICSHFSRELISRLFNGSQGTKCKLCLPSNPTRGMQIKTKRDVEMPSLLMFKVNIQISNSLWPKNYSTV